MTDQALVDRDHPPLIHDLNQGESWGLEYPIISG